MSTRNLLLIALILCAAVIGCDRSDESSRRATNFIERDITTFQSLGPLRASGHPARQDVWLEDPDDPYSERHPGGFVLREIDPESPLVEECQVGDVLIRINREWLPNVADPTLPLIEMIEHAVATDGADIEIGILRRGKPLSATVSLDLLPLDEGLPGMTVRCDWMANRAIDWLAAAQAADGSFRTAEASRDARLTVTALAGLAFVAAGNRLDQGPRSTNVRRCRDSIRDTLADVDDIRPGDGSVGVSLALTFLAELAGHGADPTVLRDLQACLQQLLQTQQEDGGWPLGDDPETLGYSDTTLATNLALLAIGMAERAGIPGDPAVIEKGCAVLRARTNDGQVVHVTEPGFDRRSEAGRAAGAAAALRALNCDPLDPFYSSLVDYQKPLLAEVESAPRGALLHLLNSAILARQSGVMGAVSFHHAFKYLLVARQQQDGSFAASPRPRERPLRFEREVSGAPFRTALFALVLLLPNEQLPLLLAVREHPMQPRRDGEGKVVEASAGVGSPIPGELPKGAQMMQFDSPEDAKEFLKGLGIDPENLENGKVIKTGKKEDG